MKTTTRLALLSSVLSGAVALSYAAPVKENWDNHCARCHGEDGTGQTKVGKKQKLKNYTDAAVQAEMKDEKMIQVTTVGVMDKGKEKMKAYKDELSADEIKDLVAFIRKFKG